MGDIDRSAGLKGATVLLYRIICLVLFVVVMGTLAQYVTSYGDWSHGFSWGVFVGGLAGVWAGYVDRRDNGPRTAEERIASSQAPRQAFNSLGLFMLVIGGLALLARH
jgi:Na+/H+-translocating membrane pyrophosphatase